MVNFSSFFPCCKDYCNVSLFCIGIYPVNSVVIVSGEQLRDSSIHSHVSVLPLFVLFQEKARLSLWLRWQRIHLQCRRPRFDPWVGKIPWRREWLSSPVFLPGESMDRGAWWATVHVVTKSQTDWATSTFTFHPPMLPSRLLYKIKQSSVCYTVSLIAYSFYFLYLKLKFNI